MLQTQSVYPSTLELLNQLMSLETLSNFNLVGGTALALKFGHRISVDIDLFSKQPFNHEELEAFLLNNFENENLKINSSKENTLLVNINKIKVDFLYYPYPLLEDKIKTENIRMLSTKDIAAMKLSAVSKRGAKKDFFDIYELLQQKYDLKDMFGFYKEKFKNHELSFLVRSLLYFDDAESDMDPVMIKTYDWTQVKTKISDEVKSYIL